MPVALHALAFARHAVRYLALHTGLPVLVVTAILLVVGYRILKKSARFVAQVLVISLILLLASELGWIRW